MAGLPAATPVTVPKLGSMVANVTSLLVHDPPVTVLFKVVCAPLHTFIVPVIAAGNAFTVNTAVVKQPADCV